LSHPDRSRQGSGRGRGGGPDLLTRIRRALRDQIRHTEFLEERLRAVQAERDAAVSASRRWMDTIIECSPEAIITLDREGCVLEWNRAAEELFGWTREEVIGKPYPLVDDALRPEFEASLRRMFRGERVRSREIRRLHKDGHYVDVSLSNAPMCSRDGEVIGVIGILVDRTEVKALTERVELLAQTVEQSPGIVFITDRDRIVRYVNPRFVELTGYAPAEVLGRSAEILDSGITPPEVMAGLAEALRAGVEFRGEIVNRRRNGEFFTVSCRVCPVRDAGGAVTAFVHHQEDISTLQTLRDALAFRSRPDPVTGLADRAAFEKEPGALSGARTACRLTQERGRDSCATLTEAEAEVRKRRGDMEWTTRIVRAMEQERIFLAWQPIVPLGKGKGQAPRNCEMLLRLRGENGEVILPGSFLPALGRHGLSVRLDRWVIDRALRWLHENRTVLDDIGMCTINLSGDSVGHPEIRDLVMRLIRELGLPGEKLCFEVTETAAVAGFAEARRFMLALRERGCRFAIDDFGSGVSSFGYLKHLPVDFLKIDGSFVRRVADGGLDSVLVRSMNEVGHALGKQTVAESVEDDRILRALKKIGVDFVQGYAVGHPEPLA
jgi:PAS domain S-box-containing protein